MLTPLLLLIPALLSSPADAGDKAPPSRAIASRCLATGQLEPAREELERLVAASPNDAVAWFQLASVARAQGDVERALAGFEAALQAPALAGEAAFQAARLHAAAGRTEEAWTFLERAVQEGLRFGGILESAPELAPLWRDRERHASLAHDFEDPPPADPEASVVFLEEDAEVLWTFESDTGFDRFGWQSEAVGDVNGDGVSEILVGGPKSAEGAPHGGKAWLLSGADGSLVRSHVGRKEGGNLGYRCKPAGDLDGDGVADYIVTAPGANSLDGSVPPDHAGLEYPGHAFLYSGASGEVLRRFEAEGPSDRFGFDAGAIGDLNGDGHRELLFGAPGHDAPVANAGRVYVVSGKDGSLLRTHAGEVVLERLGSAIGPLDDVDGDGVEDYVLGAPGAGPSRAGRAYVHSGKSGERLFVLDPERDLPEARAVEFGRFFASAAGDLDGDGTGDIYLADSFDQSAGLASGRVYLYSGATGKLLFSVAGDDNNDWYGIGRGIQQDWDGDGTPDLALAALSSSAGAMNAGRVDVLSGRDGSRLRSYTSTVAHLCLGFDVHPVGDADGDGTVDLFITGSWTQWHPRLRCRGVLVRGVRKERE